MYNQVQQQAQANPVPARKSRRNTWLKYGGTAIGAFVLGIAAGSSSGSGATTAADASTVTVHEPAQTVYETAAAAPAETVTVTESPEPAATQDGSSIPGDGTFQVGVDVQPGTYISTTPDSGNCYWARLSGSDGFGNIIDNSNSSGQSLVTIKATDKFFESRGCNAWTVR
ncbi:hypothetical protein [Yimella sp. NH-Cas1]|uniref:hypothetical protein n=1 Tax=Yimella sp. NH-Cas1 TaxID=2917726 RepID=UPI001EFB7274|nr:hypothetical protein [Yimella sp. NH-Cas1]MCG8654870.1 hypothetical protein [Yimella sp. NH-Cas1]